MLGGRGDDGVKAKYWKAKPRIKFNSDHLREINKNHRETAKLNSLDGFILSHGFLSSQSLTVICDDGTE